MEVVDDQRVCAELEQCEPGIAVSGLGCKVDGGDALAVVEAAEGPAEVRVRPELDEPAD